MKHIDIKRAGITSAIGVVAILFILKAARVHDYLIVVTWVNFLIATYFYFRLENLVTRSVLMFMAESEMTKGRLSVVLQILKEFQDS